MTRSETTEPPIVMTSTDRLARRFSRRRSVDLLAVAVRPADHFTRLWPASSEHPADAPLFLLAVAPLRLAALSLLWATSSPGRLVVALLVATGLLAAVLVLL